LESFNESTENSVPVVKVAEVTVNGSIPVFSISQICVEGFVVATVPKSHGEVWLRVICGSTSIPSPEIGYIIGEFSLTAL